MWGVLIMKEYSRKMAQIPRIWMGIVDQEGIWQNHEFEPTANEESFTKA